MNEERKLNSGSVSGLRCEIGLKNWKALLESTCSQDSSVNRTKLLKLKLKVTIKHSISQ